ncbi:MAG TPA: LysM peptidoglycan-binding domain-containing protein [Steroidobacteraceae bacterium]|nr:LysM peptidoglycan-binding domain-containing protein [Steroidobacteraceae bacterium]
MPLALLAGLVGCAYAPPHSDHKTAEALISTSAPASVAVPATAAGVTSESSAAANEAAVQNIDPPAFTDHSFVSPLPPDLFLRLRAGFKLQDVDEPAVDRELNWYANHPDYLERTWGRAEHYLHYIVQQLAARSMPLELALLPVVESAFEPYAYSRARASGLWQFIPGTGTNYGLKQNWWYDGRRDVVASTRAALDYLQSLHDSLDGDWLLAIAAYNCGEGNVQRAVNHNLRLGKPIDFWHLKLPTETRAYVPKLLAMRRIVANPAAYGLEFSQIDDGPYFTQIRTGGQIDLQVAAQIAGMTKDELYELNPAFHRWATDPTGPYSLLVPIDVADGLEQTLLTLTPEQRMRVTTYEVQRGDTLAGIAKENSTTPELLRHLNGLEPNDKPVVGSTLMVPSTAIELPEKALRAAALVDRPERRHGRRSAHGLHVVRRGDTLYSLAHRLGTDAHTLARLNNMEISDPLRAGQRLVVSDRAARTSSASRSASTTAPATSGRQVTYTVRPGDTLYGIARLLQVTLHDLLGWNAMTAGSAIRPGQKLVAFVSSHG